MKKGLLISIEGIDASGKTTYAKEVVSYLQSENFKIEYFNRKNISIDNDYVYAHMLSLYNIIWSKGNIFELGPNIKHHGFPVEHWLHLILAWYYIIEEYYIRPLLDRGISLLADGYLYKDAVKFIDSFNNYSTLEHFDKLKKPDHIIYINVNPDLCKSFRNKINTIESGLFEGKVESFENHQHDLDEIYKNLSVQYNWATIERIENLPFMVKRVSEYVKDILIKNDNYSYR